MFAEFEVHGFNFAKNVVVNVYGFNLLWPL